MRYYFEKICIKVKKKRQDKSRKVDEKLRNGLFNEGFQVARFLQYLKR